MLKSGLAFLLVAAAVCAVSGLSPDRTVSAASCSGYYSDVSPPSTIRLWDDFRGTNRIYTIDFKLYVKQVLPREWADGDPMTALQAGAMAVTNFSWWWVNNGPKGWIGGQCCDVESTTNSQVWGPSYPPEFTPQDVAKIDEAVNSIWAAARMTKPAWIFPANYETGWPSDGCGDPNGGTGSTNGAPIGRNMSQSGSLLTSLLGGRRMSAQESRVA